MRCNAQTYEAGNDKPGGLVGVQLKTSSDMRVRYMYSTRNMTITEEMSCNERALNGNMHISIDTSSCKKHCASYLRQVAMEIMFLLRIKAYELVQKYSNVYDS